MEWWNPFSWNVTTWGNVGIGILTGLASGWITGIKAGRKVNKEFADEGNKRETINALSRAFYDLITLDIYLTTYKNNPSSSQMRDRIESHLYHLVAEFRHITTYKLYSYSNEGSTDINNTGGFLTGLMNKFSNGSSPNTIELTEAIDTLGATENNEGYKSKILNELEKLQGYRQ